MRSKQKNSKASAERVVKDIRRQTRKQYSAEEKIRIVLEGLRGDDTIAELCRREGIAQGVYYKWSKDFMEGGKKRLAGEDADVIALRRPNLLWFNANLTLGLLVALVLGILPLPALFMISFSIAMIVNYPNLEEQRRRIADHAKNVIAVVSLIFAAGIFTGILGGTGMVEAMSKGFLAIIPEAWGSYLAPITALASMPFTFFISNDAFYFGVLPVVSEAAGHYGISPAEMARASLIGQPVHLLSPLVASTYLLVGLADVEFGDHQRFTIKWAVLICLMMLGASLLFGIFPLVGG